MTFFSPTHHRGHFFKSTWPFFSHKSNTGPPLFSLRWRFFCPHRVPFLVYAGVFFHTTGPPFFSLRWRFFSPTHHRAPLHNWFFFLFTGPPFLVYEAFFANLPPGSLFVVYAGFFLAMPLPSPLFSVYAGIFFRQPTPLHNWLFFCYSPGPLL